MLLTYLLDDGAVTGDGESAVGTRVDGLGRAGGSQGGREAVVRRRRRGRVRGAGGRRGSGRRNRGGRPGEQPRPSGPSSPSPRSLPRTPRLLVRYVRRDRKLLLAFAALENVLVVS